MTDYYEGATVRIAATFSFDVNDYVHFKLDNDDCSLNQENEAAGLEIQTDPANTKRCYVDIDTYGKTGTHEYWFYSRGPYKAGIKGTFKIV